MIVGFIIIIIIGYRICMHAISFHVYMYAIQLWARAYRDREYHAAVNTNNGTESQNKVLKYSYLPKKKTMTLSNITTMLKNIYQMHIESIYFKTFNNLLTTDLIMIISLLFFKAVHVKLFFTVWIGKEAAINLHQKISKMSIFSKEYSLCTVKKEKCIQSTLELLQRITCLIVHVLIGVLITYLVSTSSQYSNIGSHGHGIIFLLNTWRVHISAWTVKQFGLIIHLYQILQTTASLYFLMLLPRNLH